MKHFVIFIIFLFSGLHLINAQPINFGDSTVISLITCDPGDEIYAKFGHTAIRIRDTEGMDVVYNYGLFDFRTKNFYWKFLRGHTDYMLGVSITENFLNEYRSRNSTVWEQELNLEREEKLKLIQLLNVNYEPANRTYRYNFVYDNCSTRPYVIIQAAINGVIVDYKAASDESYREIISKYLRNDAWVDLGINLILGFDADKLAGEQGNSFVPANLKSYFQRAKILDFNDRNIERKLVSKSDMIVQAKPQQVVRTSLLLHPFVFSLLWFMTGILLTLLKERKNKIYKIFDTFLFLFTGLAGLLILVFSFFSDHPLVGNNLNLLWLNPLNILVAFMLWYRGARKFLFFYNFFSLMLILIFIVVNVFFVHSIVLAVIPLTALIFIRTLRREERLLHILITPTSKGLTWRN